MRSLTFLLLWLSATALSKRVPWWAIKLGQEQGPNACVVEENPATGKKLWTECKYWVPREICGQKTIVRYECCEGFEQIEGHPGCTGVLPLGNVVETARRLGATMFADFLEESKLTDQLTKEGAYTLLVPTNKALEEAPFEVVSQLELYSRDPRNPLLLYHLVDGRVTTDNINKDLLVESRNGASKLRFNAYATGAVTVNCVPIIRKNQQASNGVVHLIDKVLNPSIYTGKSIVNTIAEDGRFAEFSKALDANGYNHELTDYPFTFFSPSDEAFQTIPSERLEKIMSDREASKALLENHMIPHPICPSAIHKEAKMRSMSKEKLSFNCDERGEYVQDISVGHEFLLATDGIIHVINDVIMPDRARSLVELLESHQMWTFLSLIQQAGLYETFSRYGDYTVFVPSEEALQAMGESRLEELREDMESLRKFIMYHSTQGRIKTSLITDNQAVMSLDEKNSLRLQVYRNGIGVENAEIIKSDIVGQNGVIHVISRVLEAPTKSAGELLRSLGTHNMFLTMMEKATRQEMSEVGQEEQAAYTFLAPSDDAFQELGQEKLDLIMRDEGYASELVKNHIVNRIVCSNSFKPELQYKAATKSGELHIIKKAGQLLINGANVEQADLMTTNGIVYLIDKVLVPQLSSQTTTYRNVTTTTSIGGGGTRIVNTTVTRTVHHYESSNGGHSSSSSGGHSSSSSGGHSSSSSGGHSSTSSGGHSSISNREHSSSSIGRHSSSSIDGHSSRSSGGDSSSSIGGHFSSSSGGHSSSSSGGHSSISSGGHSSISSGGHSSISNGGYSSSSNREHSSSSIDGHSSSSNGGDSSSSNGGHSSSSNGGHYSISSGGHSSSSNGGYSTSSNGGHSSSSNGGHSSSSNGGYSSSSTNSGHSSSSIGGHFSSSSSGQTSNSRTTIVSEHTSSSSGGHTSSSSDGHTSSSSTTIVSGSDLSHIPVHPGTYFEHADVYPTSDEHTNEEHIDEYTHQPDEYTHQPDEDTHQPDEDTHQPDEYTYQPDEYTYDPDEYTYDPDEYTYEPDEYSEEKDYDI